MAIYYLTLKDTGTGHSNLQRVTGYNGKLADDCIETLAREWSGPRDSDVEIEWWLDLSYSDDDPDGDLGHDTMVIPAVTREEE